MSASPALEGGVGVDVVRVLDGAVIAHWDMPAVAPETVQRVAWDGTAAGVVQADGGYAFRLSVAGLASDPLPTLRSWLSRG